MDDLLFIEGRGGERRSGQVWLAWGEKIEWRRDEELLGLFFAWI
jgi:hypothetical protein